MSDEELRDSINLIAQKIVEIEDAAKKKLNYVNSRLSKDYDDKIKQVEEALEKNQYKLIEINKKLEFLSSNKKELEPMIKKLEKQRKKLRKEKKIVLDKKIKAIKDEKKSKMKEVNKKIKIIEKELKKTN
jgi:hypothetical protein